MNDFELLRAIWPLLIPIILIQLVLIGFALRDLMGRERLRGPRWMWVVVIVFLNLVGPVLYFVVGREDA